MQRQRLPRKHIYEQIEEYRIEQSNNLQELFMDYGSTERHFMCWKFELQNQHFTSISFRDPSLEYTQGLGIAVLGMNDDGPRPYRTPAPQAASIAAPSQEEKSEPLLELDFLKYPIIKNQTPTGLNPSALFGGGAGSGSGAGSSSAGADHKAAKRSHSEIEHDGQKPSEDPTEVAAKKAAKEAAKEATKDAATDEESDVAVMSPLLKRARKR